MNRAKALEGHAISNRRELFEVVCPDCGATLCVDTAWLAARPEFDCAGCGRTVALDEDGALRNPLWGKLRLVRPA